MATSADLLTFLRGLSAPQTAQTAPQADALSGVLGMARSAPQTVMSADNQADPNWRERARWQASNINSLPGVMSPNSMTSDRLQNTLNMTPINLQSQPQTVAMMQLLHGILPPSDFARLKALGGPWLQSDDAYNQVFGTARDGSAFLPKTVASTSFGPGSQQQALANTYSSQD